MPHPIEPAQQGIRCRLTYHEQVRQFRKLLIDSSLFEHDGNRSRAAQALASSARIWSA